MRVQYSENDILSFLDESNTSIDELYTLIGKDLPGHEGFGSDAVAKAMAAVRNSMGRIRRELCPILAQPKYRQWIDSGNSGDAINLVSATASLIADLGITLNETLLAVLLVRIGLRTICPN